jgi:hypothetical protein
MLTDILSDTRDSLKSSLQHYTSGTFKDYYTPEVVNEVKDIISRIEAVANKINNSDMESIALFGNTMGKKDSLPENDFGNYE